MIDFTINSACLPLYTKEIAIEKTDTIFQALDDYICYNSKPKIYFDKDDDKLLLFSEYSFEEYIDEIKERKRELADFLSEYFDHYKQKIDENYNKFKIKVGNDTRYKDNISLKHACFNNNILISITNEPLWERHKIHFTIDNYKNHSKRDYELYNLFNNDYSYLPLPPFTLENNSKFYKTKFFYGNQSIYLELSTGYYWYYDFFHRENKQHYEVFDKLGNHIGEASMSGDLNRSLADSNKTIKDIIK